VCQGELECVSLSVTSTLVYNLQERPEANHVEALAGLYSKAGAHKGATLGCYTDILH